MPFLPRTIGARSPSSPPPRAPDDRPDSTKRGYSYRWKKYARAYIAAHPLCAHCLAKDRSTLASCVDHVIPITDAGEADPNFWRQDNHQPLCHPCHNRKTAKDRAAGLTR